jgi:tetratricopeptide (TPR) repeat protein
MRREAFLSLILTAVTVAVFWQVTNSEFVNFDDDQYVTENSHVHEGLTREALIWAFTTSHMGNWHPLTWMSHMVDCQIFGLNPRGHHLTSLFFHTLNTVLLFMVLKWMTGALWQSLFVSALFAVHPLHVESVAWVAERKDVLSTLFWMLTLWAYLGYTKRPGVKRYLIIILPFALGLMAKPMLVTLPFVLLLLDYWPLKRIELGQSGTGPPAAIQPSTIAKEPRAQALRLLLEKTPLFVLAAVSSIVTFIFQKSEGAVRTLEVYPAQARISNALVSYVIYIKKMIWPESLAVFYPHPGQSLPMYQAVLAGLLLLIISFAVIRLGRRYPYLPVGWLWYVGTLIPVIGLVQVGAQAMADRYTYVPLIGLFLLVSWGVPELVRSWRYRRTALALAAGFLLLALMPCTWLQVQNWRSSTALFEHALQATANNALAHHNLGVALADQGRVQEAITHYHLSLRITPNNFKVYNNLGKALVRQGKLQEALIHYQKALSLNPNYAEAHNNLGIARARLGDFDEAIDHYFEALRLKPDWLEVYNNLANAFSAQGKFEQAIAYYSKVLSLKPDYADANNNLAIALAGRGRFSEALTYYSEALRLEPDSAEIHNNLAVALFNLGKLQAALAHYAKAIELSPNYAEAHNNLGNALAQQEKLGEAEAHYLKALKIKADYPEVHNNLGVALARQGRLDEAIVHFSEALRLQPNYAQARANLELALQEAGRSN